MRPQRTSRGDDAPTVARSIIGSIIGSSEASALSISQILAEFCQLMTSHASYYPVMEFCAQYYRLITGITCGINTAVLVLLRHIPT